MVDGRFELVARLGGGGMGTVWRARDLALHREVALKEVRPPDPALAEYDPEAARELRSRVLREARALARVAHPRVVTIHHIVDGGEGTYPWLVMELVEGGSLQDRIDRGTLTRAEAATLGRGILAGLRAAHAAGIQHRDIKPANVLLRPDGGPVLTDFGIAAIHGATALTAAGSIIGTPDYMAPERVSGEEGGPAADLWSLAMTLYVAVEGRHPLRRANTLATLAAVLGEDVPPPRRAGPLTRVLTEVLVRDPATRPDGEALDRLLAEAETAGAAGTLEAGTQGAARNLEAGTQGAARTADAVAEAEKRDTARTTGAAAEPRDPVPPVTTPRAPDTATSYPLAPPAPPAPRKRRSAWYAGSAAAVALSGVLVWTLMPDGGGSDGDSTAGPNGGDRPSSPATATGTTTKPTSGGSSGITIGIKFDQPGLGWRKPDGTYAGLDVDVATYVARALGHQAADVTWKEARSSTRESLLTGGDVDLVVATYAINDKRRRQVDFAGPYLVAHQDVLLRADSTVAEPADLNGLTVCSATGSTSALTIRTLIAPQAQVRTYDTYAQCMTALNSGEVDAVTTDDALLAGYATQDGPEGRFKLAGFRLTEERYGIGLPKGSALRAKVQSALARMVTDGSWNRAVEKNLPLLRTDPPPLTD
ncbi:bifunctional serine/threonine-protein kinase/glutamate ABC transporter substrate-binding protein [Streptomyces tanashiensis]|uniref:bifunctional serine/threonine-protein kinase/glutamate ABC transporter substrate-binding protein n=1 Tax=Streptomyces tanashiensis TaxID=67367 RepID=UPI00167D38FE|nr:bifunctional serine/threonine-protein kinase/glutamate ABC transporter substrate-binding protein [Streptomyces tanashiensis]